MSLFIFAMMFSEDSVDSAMGMLLPLAGMEHSEVNVPAWGGLGMAAPHACMYGLTAEAKWYRGGLNTDTVSTVAASQLMCFIEERWVCLLYAYL